MAKEVIVAADEPWRKFPLSPAIKAGDYIFVSGQPGSPDEKGVEIKGIESQTKHSLESIKRILESIGASMNDVVETTVFVAEKVTAGEYAKLNKVYKQYFSRDYPVRVGVRVGFMYPDMLVEIKCIAYHP